MTEAAKAMATWLGALARPGFALGSQEKAGLGIASYVLGEGRLKELRTWIAFQLPEVQQRELGATIEAMVHIAHVDQDFDENERRFLEHVITNAELGEDFQAELRAKLDTPQPLGDLSARITHEVLREMLLALAWELALADQRVAAEEITAYDDLARRLGVSGLRANELRAALSAEI